MTAKTNSSGRPLWLLPLIIAVPLGVLAYANLFLTLTPMKAIDERIDDRLAAAAVLPEPERLAPFNDLRQEQREVLAYKPSDPYGWARLSYLRLITEHDPEKAFAALRLSDLVSPYEAPQLPERAMMWRRLRSAENQEQQDYQDALWLKAFSLEPEATWQIAKKNGLLEELGQVLQKKDPPHYDQFQEFNQKEPAP